MTTRRARAVSLLFLVLGLAVPVLASSASSEYSAGVTAEMQNRTDAAYEAYQRAYAKKPSDPKYLAAYTRLRFRAAAEHVHTGEGLLESGNLPLALAEFVRAEEIDPSNAMAQQEARRTQELIDKAAAAKAQPEAPEEPLARVADDVKGPVRLQPLPNMPVTLNMTENSDVIYKTIAKLAGLNIVFDPDYKPQKLSIELNSVALSDALQILTWASRTFWRPLTPNTIFVATENPGKRKEAEQSVMKTFYLANTASAADLTEAATALHSMLDIARVQPIPSQNALLVRATPDQLVLAEKLLSDIDKARGEVVMDVAILEVTRDSLRTLGASLPTSASVALAPGGSTSGSLTLNSLANLTAKDFLVSIPGASFTALMTDSNTKIIQNPEMRVLDNEKATLKIGDRVPVATGSFSPGVGAGAVNVLVNTQFQYLDVGVSVDITPHIHSRHEVTLKIGMEISSVTGQQNIGGVTQPVIGQRRIEHETRLREGEVNLLGGFLEDSQSDAISGYPWLAKVPLMRYFFGQNQKQNVQREIVFAITPHIIRAQDVSAANLRAIVVGSPDSIELRYNDARKAPAPATAPSPAMPAAQQSMPAMPPIPGAPTTPVAQPTPSTPPIPANGQNPIPMPTPAQAHQLGAPPQQGVSPAMPEQLKPTDVAYPQPGKPGAATMQNATPSASTPALETAGIATLSFEPSAISQAVGSTFKVSIGVSGAKNAFSMPIEISYDPRHVQIVDVSNGGFLGQDMQPVAVVYRADTIKGTLQITGTRPPNSGGVSGSGTAFVLTLTSKSAGESVLAITGPTVLDANMQALPAVGGKALLKTIGSEAPQNKTNPVADPVQ